MLQFQQQLGLFLYRIGGQIHHPKLRPGHHAVFIAIIILQVHTALQDDGIAMPMRVVDHGIPILTNGDAKVRDRALEGRLIVQGHAVVVVLHHDMVVRIGNHESKGGRLIHNCVMLRLGPQNIDVVPGGASRDQISGAGYGIQKEPVVIHSIHYVSVYSNRWQWQSCSQLKLIVVSSPMCRICGKLRIGSAGSG